MEDLQGVTLDFDKMSTSIWTLYFTGGTYNVNGALRTVEPGVINLKKSDYDNFQNDVFYTYYDPYKNNYSIVERADNILEDDYCEDYGINLGGFLVNGCELRYLHPITEDVIYVRAFEDEAYDEGFIEESEAIGSDVPIQSFSNDFGYDFRTGNDLPVNTDSEFSTSEFDSAFNND